MGDGEAWGPCSPGLGIVCISQSRLGCGEEAGAEKETGWECGVLPG